jgi:ADP-ribose pyrophosphatase
MPTEPNTTPVYLGDAKDGEIQILRECPVYQNEYGTLYDDAVLFPSGAAGHYIRFLSSAPFSVAILPIMADGRIALIKVFRHALRNWILEIPKGFGDANHEPAFLAEKELMEETGLQATSIRKSIEVITDPSFTGSRMLLFIAEGCVQAKPAEPEDYETIESVKTFSIPEITQMIQSGEISDLVSLLALSSFIGENSRNTFSTGNA